MKIAIDNNGNRIEVSEDTPVDTIDGVYYLLTPEREAEETLRSESWLASAGQRNNTISEINRFNAYKEESDPLFFKYMRNEVTQEEWLNKVNEIKNRYPKV